MASQVLIQLRPEDPHPLLMAVAGVLVAESAAELDLFSCVRCAAADSRADALARENDAKACRCAPLSRRSSLCAFRHFQPSGR